jgi:hypothetical protein
MELPANHAEIGVEKRQSLRRGMVEPITSGSKEPVCGEWEPYLGIKKSYKSPDYLSKAPTRQPHKNSAEVVRCDVRGVTLVGDYGYGIQRDVAAHKGTFIRIVHGGNSPGEIVAIAGRIEVAASCRRTDPGESEDAYRAKLIPV